MKIHTAFLFIVLTASACNAGLDEADSIPVPVNVRTKGDGSTESLQVLAFDTSGKLAAYSAGSGTRTLRLRKSASYDILALVGCPDVDRAGMSTLEAVSSTGMDLAAYNDPSSGFAASASARISPVGSGSLSLQASRYVCRIRLVSVENRLPPSMGSVSLQNAFLSNVVAHQTIGAEGSGWLNPMGRATGNPVVESQVIDGDNYLASAPGLTFHGYGRTLPYGTTVTLDSDFYCYPNPSAADAQGFSATMGSRYTRLVLTTLTAGSMRYYPISIPLPERNTSYDVSVVISNLGSEDPDKTLSTGAMTTSMTISEWDFGNEIPTNF